MKKLWKVTVNNWGWNHCRTFYADSRDEAERIRNRFPAADPVKYAGLFTEQNAKERLSGWLDYKMNREIEQIAASAPYEDD